MGFKGVSARMRNYFRHTEHVDAMEDEDESYESSKVYVFQAGPFGKIGTTTGTIQNRLNALRTGCPYPLACIAWGYGDRGLERELHERFREWHQHGEWFDLDPIRDELLDALPERLG